MKDFEFSLDLVKELIDVAKKKDISKLKVKYKEFEVFIDVKEPVLNFAPPNFKSQEFLGLEKELKIDRNEEEKIEGKLEVCLLLELFIANLLLIKKILLKLEIELKKGMYFL